MIRQATAGDAEAVFALTQALTTDEHFPQTAFQALLREPLD